jgi:flagellar biogenesis protein FliO
VRKLAEAAYLSRPAAGADPAATADRERFRKHATLVLVLLLVLALGGMVVYLLRASARERARTQNSRVFLIESTE